ncbi:hypothetical protein SAMN05428962_2757 [Paenibacillus sp. BC26]|nr:hypothetical protein SAMN05428962_2757 [Paenibacillus sp. BC26]
MPILVIIFYILVIILKPNICWLASAVWYVVSFLGSWSNGLLLLFFPFILCTFALAHNIGLIKKLTHAAVSLVIGILLWIISISIIDDYWLFYPFSRFFG